MMTIEELIPMIVKMKPYFGATGGLTVSGGEPLLQARELLPFFKILKEEGIHITIDTNGFVRNDDVEELLHYVDLVLLDLKHMDNHRHKKITGQPNERVHAFLDHLQTLQMPTWIRYVFVPNYTDQIRSLHELGESFGGYSCIQRVEILPYHTLGVHKRKHLGRTYELEDVVAPNYKELSTVKHIFEQYFPLVLTR